MMLVLINVLYVIQVVPLVQVQLLVSHAMLENSGLLKIQFVSAKMDISNLFMKTEQSYVLNVLLNAKLVLKVLFNVLHVTQQLTELKVTTH